MDGYIVLCAVAEYIFETKTSYQFRTSNQKKNIEMNKRNRVLSIFYFSYQSNDYCTLKKMNFFRAATRTVSLFNNIKGMRKRMRKK